MKSVRDIDEKMEQPSTAALEYVRIQKGRGFVYAVGNELYKRVKTETPPLRRTSVDYEIHSRSTTIVRARQPVSY